MAAGKRPIILYIEDDAGSQSLILRILQHAGYDVRIAPNGLSGIDMARIHQPDLILMDINLPDLSGREVTTRLRALPGFRHTPIVALTALSHAGEREKAIAAGLTGYIAKPVDIDTFPAQIAEYLAGKQDQVDPEILAEARTAYSQEIVERLEAKIRQLERAYTDLKRLDRMKEAFIQLTSHELRTPLTVIYGYGRLLQESPVVARVAQEDEEFASLIDTLVEGIDRMAAVINEILLVSRIASGRVELVVNPVNIGALIEEVVADYASASAQRRQQVIVDAVDARIYADRDLLALALANLLGNAIKYTPDGGTITLRAMLHGDQALITVQDTGIGIDKADQALIFESFYTAGDTQLHASSKVAFRGGGLGLGLAICAEIVKAHDGRIWVDSPGRDEQRLPGSVFSIALPTRSKLSAPYLDAIRE